MSAEILVMNKNGIALAADSAGTYRHKIFNSYNKLFMLSNLYPIGIMVYNNNSFLGIPLEILIKEYRRNIDSKWNNSIVEVKDCFIKFLCDVGMKYKNDSQYILGVFHYIFTLLSEEIKDIIDTIFEKDSNALENMRQFEEAIEIYLSSKKTSQLEVPIYDCFQNDYDDIKKEIIQNFTPFVDRIMEDQNLPDIRVLQTFYKNFKDLILDICCEYFLRNTEKFDYSGVVIAGYGSDSYYPSFTSFRLIGFYKDRCITVNDSTIEIGKDGFDQYIGAFAQQDMVVAYMTGIHGRYKQQIINTIDKYVKDNISKFEDNGMQLKTILEHDIESMRANEFFNPFVDFISVMPKEELAIVAENLVNLTLFKRRIANDELGGTVGGPIDVAIISRDDGFIWIKRKHYFDKEYNHHFFATYYSKGRVKGDESSGE